MSSTDRLNRLLLAEDWKRVYQSYKNAEFLEKRYKQGNVDIISKEKSLELPKMRENQVDVEKFVLRENCSLQNQTQRIKYIAYNAFIILQRIQCAINGSKNSFADQKRIEEAWF